MTDLMHTYILSESQVFNFSNMFPAYKLINNGNDYFEVKQMVKISTIKRNIKMSTNFGAISKHEKFRSPHFAGVFWKRH